MFRKWAIFARERFPLGSHLVMVAAFTVGNLKLAQHFSPAESLVSFKEPLFQADFFLLALLALLFFFRLRLFDEIKDYEVDLKVNPTRPLARGLISVKEAKNAVGCVLALELVTCFLLNGIFGIFFHLPAIAYSFLMYREFFIGNFLRPRLTTYAVLHTYVSVLLGFSLSLHWLGHSGLSLPLQNFLFLFVNWGFFNLFEFARKTFSPQEERPNVESYSKVFSLPGAVLLSWSQVVLPLLLLLYLGFFQNRPLEGNVLATIAFVLTIATGIYFILKRSTSSAKIFRLGVSLYLILGYLGLSLVGTL